MTKIAIIEPIPTSAVAFYRSIGPLSFLHKLDNIELTYPASCEWQNLAGNDILYYERPQYDHDVRNIKLAKSFGLKVWIDYDDILHEVPQHNPFYQFYSSDETKKNIETCMQLADVVTVSAQAIKDYYKSVCNAVVLPNAFNDYLYKLGTHNKSLDTREPFIGWRGTQTHRKDLLSVKNALVNIDKNYDINWFFCGSELWYIIESLTKKCYNVKECNLLEYMNVIHANSPEIFIVPLEDNIFNRGKSNIAFIESVYAGSACIAPELPEFMIDGCVNYRDSEHFEYLMGKLIKSKSFRRENYDKAVAYVSSNLMLSEVNKMRIEVIHGIL